MNDFSKLEKAKSQLVLHQAFFATVLMSLPLELTEAIPTAATNGVRIVFNPNFLEQLSVDETQFILAHEVLHVTMLHPWRRDGRDLELWNQAIDHADNLILLDAGFQMPQKLPGLADPKYKDWSSEKIYNDLQQQQGEGDGEGEGQGNVFRDECQDAPGDEAEQAQSQAKAQMVVAQAAKAAQMAGQLPASLQQLVDGILKPKVNWREELKHFMTAVLKQDQSWQRGQRRFLAEGLYLPSFYSEGMGELVVGVDTSGSVWHRVPEFLAEVSAIAAECRPEKITVIYCDTQVNYTAEYESGDEVEMKQCGGGGTDLTKIFDYVQVKGINPKVAVVLTDLETPFGSEPEYPVIWAAVGTQPAPWGDVIRMGD